MMLVDQADVVRCLVPNITLTYAVGPRCRISNFKLGSVRLKRRNSPGVEATLS